MELYVSLGIQDYFLYDAEGLYLPSPIMGFTLIDGSYAPISAGIDGGLHSTTLGLDFHAGDVGLSIYDPVAGAWVQTPAESAVRRVELAETRANQAETRAGLAETRANQAETRAGLAETRANQAETRAGLAETRANQAETRADQETDARQRVEAELTKLREENERLKALT